MWSMPELSTKWGFSHGFALARAEAPFLSRSLNKNLGLLGDSLSAIDWSNLHLRSVRSRKWSKNVRNQSEVDRIEEDTTRIRDASSAPIPPNCQSTVMVKSPTRHLRSDIVARSRVRGRIEIEVDGRQSATAIAGDHPCPNNVHSIPPEPTSSSRRRCKSEEKYSLSRWVVLEIRGRPMLMPHTSNNNLTSTLLLPGGFLRWQTRA